MRKIPALYLKLTGATLTVLLSLTSSSFAAPTVKDKNSCADSVLTGKTKREGSDRGAEANRRALEIEVKALLCRAQRAEASAAWHEERAKVWEEIDAHQYATGELTSAGEPLAAFFARTHRNQKEKRLLEAQSLRQKAKLLASVPDQRF